MRDVVTLCLRNRREEQNRQSSPPPKECRGIERGLELLASRGMDVPTPLDVENFGSWGRPAIWPLEEEGECCRDANEDDSESVGSTEADDKGLSFARPTRAACR